MREMAHTKKSPIVKSPNKTNPKPNTGHDSPLKK